MIKFEFSFNLDFPQQASQRWFLAIPPYWYYHWFHKTHTNYVPHHAVTLLELHDIRVHTPKKMFATYDGYLVISFLLFLLLFSSPCCIHGSRCQDSLSHTCDVVMTWNSFLNYTSHSAATKLTNNKLRKYSNKKNIRNIELNDTYWVLLKCFYIANCVSVCEVGICRLSSASPHSLAGWQMGRNPS